MLRSRLRKHRAVHRLRRRLATRLRVKLLLIRSRSAMARVVRARGRSMLGFRCAVHSALCSVSVLSILFLVASSGFAALSQDEECRARRSLRLPAPAAFAIVCMRSARSMRIGHHRKRDVCRCRRNAKTAAGQNRNKVPGRSTRGTTGYRNIT
jgi:hypothetical protein